MTQENKELLVKDLCARLPYGVCCKHTIWDEELGEVEVVVKIYSVNHDGYVRNCCDDEIVYIDTVKPYLFPLSSMTKEQQKEANIFDDMDIDILSENLDRNRRNKTNIPTPTFNYTDWLNKNHFDYRGLIEKGLAIDATGLNIY